MSFVLSTLFLSLLSWDIKKKVYCKMLERMKSLLKGYSQTHTDTKTNFFTPAAYAHGVNMTSCNEQYTLSRGEKARRTAWFGQYAYALMSIWYFMYACVCVSLYFQKLEIRSDHDAINSTAILFLPYKEAISLDYNQFTGLWVQ